MKEVTKSHKLNIPTREEFHRYAGNLLTPDDFNTTCPNNSIERTCEAIEWSISHGKEHFKQI